MSNLIPPLLSSSPPPIVGPLDEEDEDEFGDFRAAADSYDCGDFSLPPSPQKSPEKELKPVFSKINLDINSNKSQKVTSTLEMPTQNVNGSVSSEEVDKDFQDRRKSSDNEDEPKSCEIQVNSSNSQSVSSSEIFDNHDSTTPVDSPQAVDEQNLDKDVCEPNSEFTSEQSSKTHPEFNPPADDFPDLEFAETSSVNCDDSTGEPVPNKIDGGQSNLNSLSEENMFDAFSESVQEITNNSDDLSETHEVSEIKSDEEINEISCKNNDEDKFANSSKETNDELNGSSLSLKVCETDPKSSDDEFGDFANFGEEVADKPEVSEDEFDDFVDSLPPQTQRVEEQGEDDFGDFESSEFADFSQTCENPAFLEVHEKNAAEKSETILKEVFPIMDIAVDEFDFVDQTKGDKIFDELKDVTETNALIYQWSKSSSQKMFFKALNIDTRNILYGPAWNSSMPRFAANLGFTPLEPVRTEILTPTPVQNISSPSNSSQKSNGDIPTAQFDWGSSGLINPLDYSQTMLLDLEQLVASLDILSTTNPSNQSPSPSNELLDEWDLWLQSTSAELPGSVPENSTPPQIPTDFLPTPDKPESLPSLFDTEIIEKISTSSNNENIELSKPSTTQDDLTPFESPKLIPLRETHISSELSDGKPGWLQPTIVTPDLPRKETVVDPEDDDEFDDFQMVLPEDNAKKSEVKSNLSLDLSDFDLSSIAPVKTPHNHEHIFGNTMNSGPIVSPVQKQTNDDDDEFTEFHSSVPQQPTFELSVPKSETFKPVPKPEILKPLQPVSVEPLKPVIQYSTPVTQINWPNPGVTDEDVRNIELTYSRDNSKDVGKENSVSKKSSLDDDEWTDFVSVTNPVKSTLPERTATPDLPLSVLNLNNVQAPKQPIPVITPTGLVQTKLSSNMTLQPKSVVQTSVQPSMFKPPTTQFQPSIISHQFAANFYQGSNAAPSSKSQDDDDDWSDFVSSRPPPQVNGYQQKAFNQAKVPQMNWGGATTNIIMNPTHFEAFSAYAPSQNKKLSPMAARNAASSISTIPDLDFIAPKNRTSKK